jgi:hypothetical protein
MSVEPVYVPPGKSVMPGTQIGKQIQTDQYWRDKALEARARREYEEETKNIEQIRNPPAPGEPPVKMTGSINLGNIDFQEQARQARESEVAARSAAETEAKRLREENEKLKSELIAGTINNLQTALTGQIQKLQTDLAAGRGNAKSIADQLKEVVDSAALLGYVRPDQQPKTPVIANATDAALSLEMLRLQLEDKRTERSFAWQMEKDRRQFQLDLRRLDQANKVAIAEVGSKHERDQMILRAPEILGGAIAKGLIAARGGGPVASQPPNRPATPRPPRPTHQAPPTDIENDTPASMSQPGQPGYEPQGSRKVEAGVGEAGSIECPECGQPIAIGPNATKGICAGCEFTVDVVRREVAHDAQN